MKKSRKVKLSPRAIAQLKADPRIQELRLTMLERELNVLERIMLNQIVAEATWEAL